MILAEEILKRYENSAQSDLSSIERTTQIYEELVAGDGAYNRLETLLDHAISTKNAQLIEVLDTFTLVHSRHMQSRDVALAKKIANQFWYRDHYDATGTIQSFGTSKDVEYLEKTARAALKHADASNDFTRQTFRRFVRAIAEIGKREFRSQAAAAALSRLSSVDDPEARFWVTKYSDKNWKRGDH